MTTQTILADSEPTPLAFAPPIEQQIQWLDAVSSNPDEYVIVWIACLTQIGCTPLVEYRDDGRHLVVWRPLEDEDSDRSGRTSQLADHMQRHRMRSDLMQEVERRRLVIDARPADLKEAMAAVRALLGMGFRFMLHPNRQIEVCGGPADILSSDATYRDCRDAMSRYRNIEWRAGSKALLHRAVRLLGREHAPSKIIVLENVA